MEQGAHSNTNRRNVKLKDHLLAFFLCRISLHSYLDVIAIDKTFRLRGMGHLDIRKSVAWQRICV